MYSFIDVYARGYKLGREHGLNNSRRRARWEILYLKPINLLPFVNKESYYDGYIHGYHDGIAVFRVRQI